MADKSGFGPTTGTSGEPPILEPGFGPTTGTSGESPILVTPRTAIVRGIAEGEKATLFGVAGISDTTAIYGESPGLAGQFVGAVDIQGVLTHLGNANFNGNMMVIGDISLPNADFAEDFDVFDAVKVAPGTVMVLGNEGTLFESHQAYDKRVAGVISGAGDYKPGIVLDKQQTMGNRQPVALMGKVFCKVDAQFGAIEVGDLLTTSSTPGHAMRADDPMKAFGAVIGKALRPLTDGQGLIPILISLQ